MTTAALAAPRRSVWEWFTSLFRRTPKTPLKVAAYQPLPDGSPMAELGTFASIANLEDVLLDRVYRTAPGSQAVNRHDLLLEARIYVRRELATKGRAPTDEAVIRHLAFRLSMTKGVGNA